MVDIPGQDAARKRLEKLETRLLLEAIHEHYGYDFRDYAAASLARQINRVMGRENLATLSALQDHLLHDEEKFCRFLAAVTVGTTAMFRDPGFYRAFRQQVVPQLRSLAPLRCWHAGCASGEEVYSMAILLHEEGLLSSARIYATDINESSLCLARERIYSQRNMREYTNNYILAGGARSFSDYYSAKHGQIILRPDLGERVVWSHHNLTTDGSFNEFHVILCRNVLIYFNQKLQRRVYQLIDDSLVPGGFLGLGGNETPRFVTAISRYETMNAQERIYRKIVSGRQEML